MPLALDIVVEQLSDYALVTPSELAPFVPPKSQPKTGDDLLRALCQKNLLTKFQAQQVAAGHAKSLALGSYTLLDKIGSGGMGEVFKARHRKMQRTVAIKMLPPTLTKDAAALTRFQREAVAAGKLRHPNIVAADDAAEARGVHFLVMEFVEGQDLSALVKQNGPLPPGKAVNYILQAARGLEFAHGEGVVHRDIKPANLLLDKKGVIKVMDLGLARIESRGNEPHGNATQQSELTGAGDVMGTVDYMAPEQALSAHLADVRADIYSLGLSLYFLLAGKAPYGGGTLMAKLLAHQQQPIPSLQDVQSGVPKPLDAVFRKMVAKKVEDRYRTMSEVIEAFEGLGFGGSAAKGEAATAWTLSDEDRKKLAANQLKAGRLGSLTKAATSEKTRFLLAKIVGGAFATIVAPILVTYLIKYLDDDKSPLDKSPPDSAGTTTAANVDHVPTATRAIPLFDGQTLKGWHGDTTLWSVEDGAIVGWAKSPIRSSSFLVTDDKYRNFILKLKFYLSQGNSGVQVRSKEKTKGIVTGPQADIGFGEDYKWLGCLSGEQMPHAKIAMTSDDTLRFLKTTVKPGMWHEMTVTVNGQSVDIQINGHTTVAVTSPEIPADAGVIALQLHRANPTAVRFKDITLEPLP